MEVSKEQLRNMSKETADRQTVFLSDRLSAESSCPELVFLTSETLERFLSDDGCDGFATHRLEDIQDVAGRMLEEAVRRLRPGGEPAGMSDADFVGGLRRMLGEHARIGERKCPDGSEYILIY